MRETATLDKMFRSIVADGHITSVQAMEDLRFPGELEHVPSYVSYGTPDGSPRLHGWVLGAGIYYRTSVCYIF